MEKAIVLFSGGLDSTTCLQIAINRFGKENVIALTCFYGQRHDKEIFVSKNLAEYYGVKHIELNLSKIFEGSDCSLLKSSNQDIPIGEYASQIATTDKPISTYVPFRNGLFLSAAASVALSNNARYIYYGIHQDDAAGNAYPDTSEIFNKSIADAIFEGSGRQVEIIAPFVHKKKADIVKEGIKLNVPYHLTWSCYKGGEKACGKCGTCIDRKKAFEANGIIDPIEYED